jgi:hypothetical protein
MLSSFSVLKSDPKPFLFKERAIGLQLSPSFGSKIISRFIFLTYGLALKKDDSPELLALFKLFIFIELFNLFLLI